MKKKKIVVRMSSGLGNQMFIYGCGYCLAKKYDMNMQIDLSKYFLRITSSRYQLNNYNITFTDIYPLLFRKSPKNKWDKWIKKKIIGLRKNLMFEFVREKSFGRNQEIELNPGKNYYFDGFWQAECFVGECREDLKKEFSLKVIRPEVQIRAGQIKSKNICGIHVRRGDYLTHYGGTLSDDFYFEAIEMIRGKNPSVEFLFFSDDIEYCKKAFSEVQGARFIEQCFSGQEELFLMSNCNELIIANSSFSWWGAFLSEAKRVICPLTEMWREDYYCSDWECIEAKMLVTNGSGLRHIAKNY